MMRKQRLVSFGLACTVGLVAAAQGQTIFDSSAGSYTGGDLNGQANWAQLLNYETNGVPFPLSQSNQLGGVTFSYDGSAWVNNDAASDTAFLVNTNGSYLYLNEASAGNDLYSEWSGTMDFNFSIPAATYAAGDLPNANFFVIGLTASTTNGLSQFQQDDVCMFLRYRANNRLDMQLHAEQDADLRIFQTPSDANTYAEPAVLLGMNPQTGDCQSDELRLTWTIRKSTDGNYSAWGSVSNLSTGVWVDDIRTNGLGGRVVSTAGKSKSAVVYASTDPVLAMGRLRSAWQEKFDVADNGLLDMDINDLTVVKSIVSPALAAPATVAALAYDSQVTVNWDAAAEASSYDVFRSTTSGSYGAAFTNLTGLSVVDAGLANDTEYFYVVQAVYDGFGNSTNSMEVSGTPVAIFSGSIVDTSFTTADGYTDGDLATQQGWVQVAGADANAFNITNAASTGEASTIGNSYNATTNLGNAVYLEKLMDNNADDTWVGSIDVQIQAYLAEGQSVATLLNQDIFVFGLTAPATQDDDLSLWDGNKALMALRQKADGNVAILFSTETADANTQLAQLQREDLSWDPENEETNGVSVADLITDPFNISWSIRKTRDEGIYQGIATLASSTATNTSLPFTIDTLSAMYDSPSAKFVMGQYKNAYKATATITNKSDTIVHSLSVTHTNSLPIPSAPVDVVAIGGDRSVALSWPAVLEATGYKVYMAETSGAPWGDLINISGSITEATYLDMPRFNGVTNYYKVQANFSGIGNALSGEVAGTPEALITQINIDGLGSDSTLISSTYNLDQTTGLQTNVANSVTYIDYSSTPFVSTQGGWTGPPMYGLSQVNSVEPDITSGKGTSGYRIRQGGTQVINGTQSDHFEFTTAGTQGEALWYVKSTDFAEPKASIDLTVDTHSVTIANQIFAGGGADEHRVAIQIGNSSTWYVSETFQGNGTLTAPDQTTIANLYDDAWAPVTITPGTWFADPTTFSKVDNDSFTNVTAIGWFAVQVTKWKPYQLIYSTSGSIPSTDYWMNQYAGVSNLTDNTDGDDLSNIQEYAFGGDPTIAGVGDGATLPGYTVENVNGTNGIVVVHVELRDPAPGIEYSLETAGSLVSPTWATDPLVEELGTANIDYYFKAVTNFIPADLASKFIDLKLNEL